VHKSKESTYRKMGAYKSERRASTEEKRHAWMKGGRKQPKEGAHMS
jgi:hypothetical protein